jgi:light-regulated signal transduction histidine kinase (bacteriophytochrome)
MPVQKRTAVPRSEQQRAGVFSDKELSDFLLRACHDLRAPARAIRAHAELFLRDAAPAADFATRLGFMVDGARKIDVLVDALASYSLALRIDASSFQASAVGALLRTALAKLQGDLRANSAEVTYGELPRVMGNPDRLIELWERLVRNSMQHRGPASPRIRIEAARENDHWVFAVRDNGPGVDTAYLERIFDPFEHGPDRADGAGMGLAICRAIVERHGGKIWAESSAGSGATFFFTLPADDQGSLS